MSRKRLLLAVGGVPITVGVAVALLALTALVATAALIAGAVRTPDRASAQEPPPSLAAVPGSVVAIQRDILLRQGWNLVGWANDASVAEAADAIAASVSHIFDFNERDKTFRFYDDASPSFLNTLTTLRAGHGLWIFATQDTTWQAPAFPLNDSQPLLLTTGFNLVTWQGPSGIAAGDAFAAIAKSWTAPGPGTPASSAARPTDRDSPPS